MMAAYKYRNGNEERMDLHTDTKHNRQEIPGGKIKKVKKVRTVALRTKRQIKENKLERKPLYSIIRSEDHASLICLLFFPFLEASAVIWAGANVEEIVATASLLYQILLPESQRDSEGVMTAASGRWCR